MIDIKNYLALAVIQNDDFSNKSMNVIIIVAIMIIIILIEGTIFNKNK